MYTNIQCHDGMGAQYQKIIQTYIYCKLNNLEYRYCPLTQIEHNYEKDLYFVEKIEQLFNLKPHIQNGIPQQCVQIDFGKVVMPWFEKNMDAHSQNIHMDFIKQCFWENKIRPIKHKTTVAIHIRRENPHDRGYAGERITTPNEYYLQIMNLIRSQYDTPRFNLYSQGNLSNFSILQGDDVSFHLNEDICETFIELVSADILVISPSSLSYSAALISEGIIYFKPFWHKPKSDWIIHS